MAALVIDEHTTTLSQALANIGELKGAVADALQKNGFTDVVNTAGEVAGNRPVGVRLSVSYLHIANRDYWQVTCAAGDTAAAAQQAVNDMVTAIKNLKFL
jgi:hypothetical protein